MNSSDTLQGFPSGSDSNLLPALFLRFQVFPGSSFPEAIHADFQTTALLPADVFQGIVLR